MVQHVLSKGLYLRQAGQHKSVISLVKSHKRQLNTQQLCVRLWQSTAASHKEQKLLFELNIPVVHYLHSSWVMPGWLISIIALS